MCGSNRFSLLQHRGAGSFIGEVIDKQIEVVNK